MSKEETDTTKKEVIFPSQKISFYYSDGSNDQIKNRVWWNNVAYNFYLSGRILTQYDMYDAGFLQLSYAIEVYFKQGLVALNSKNHDVAYKHNLMDQFSECQKVGAFTGIDIPSDFLEYANYLLNWRYPTQINKTIKHFQDKDKTVSKEFRIIHCYDEVIQQLDKWLLEYTKDKYASAILSICAGIDSDNNRLGLSYNSAVIKNLDYYRTQAAIHYPNNTEAKSRLANGKASFWNSSINERAISLDLELGAKLIANFKLPGSIERDEDGNVLTLTYGSAFTI